MEENQQVETKTEELVVEEKKTKKAGSTKAVYIMNFIGVALCVVLIAAFFVALSMGDFSQESESLGEGLGNALGVAIAIVLSTIMFIPACGVNAIWQLVAGICFVKKDGLFKNVYYVFSGIFKIIGSILLVLSGLLMFSGFERVNPVFGLVIAILFLVLAIYLILVFVLELVDRKSRKNKMQLGLM